MAQRSPPAARVKTKNRNGPSSSFLGAVFALTARASLKQVGLGTSPSLLLYRYNKITDEDSVCRCLLFAWSVHVPQALLIPHAYGATRQRAMPCCFPIRFETLAHVGHFLSPSRYCYSCAFTTSIMRRGAHMHAGVFSQLHRSSDLTDTS